MKFRFQTLANRKLVPESDESDMESLTFGLSIYSLRLSVRNTIYSYENELIGRKLDSFFFLFVLFLFCYTTVSLALTNRIRVIGFDSL